MQGSAADNSAARADDTVDVAPSSAQDIHTNGENSDEEMRARMEKTATCVVRNGLDFEEVIKRNEQNNPDFAFLFGAPLRQRYDELKRSIKQELTSPEGKMRAKMEWVADCVMQYGVGHEEMYKRIEADNPDFAFLFGSPHRQEYDELLRSKQELQRAAPDSTGGSLNETTETAVTETYPCWGISAEELLKLDGWVPHQDLLEQGKLVKLGEQPDKHIVFISHQWCSFHHPDPSGEQLRVLVRSHGGLDPADPDNV